MSEQTPPYPYFNGIIYNQSLFGGQSGQYLPRTGVATSVATSTTFNGIVYTSGLTDSSTISATNLSVSGTNNFNGLSYVNNTLYLNDTPLYIRQNDPHHGICYGLGTTTPSLNIGVDGPYVFGYYGGALGTTFGGSNTLALQWNKSGVVTLPYPPVMSGASITSASIPDTALSNNVALLTGTQTFSGAKTFSTAPVMSGASITSRTITDGSLSTNVALLTGTQTFSGAKTFSTAPVMSGASISSASIPDTALSTNVALLNASNIFTGTTNTFTGSGINITNGVSGGSGGINIQQTNTVTQTIQWLNSGGFAQANIYASSLSNVLSFDITSLLTNGIRFTLAGAILMTLSTTGLMTLLTSPAFSYTTLPTLSSSQLGYSVPITVNSPGSNSPGNAYYLLATITSMPIGVFIINYTVYTNNAGAGMKIGLSTSSNTSTNTYLNDTDLIAGGMSSYYYVFSNTSVRTIYIMGYAGVTITFSTNYGNNSASCVRIA